MSDINTPVQEMNNALDKLKSECPAMADFLKEKFTNVVDWYEEILAIKAEEVPKAAFTKPQICYKTDKICPVNCSGLCRNSY